jgi:hypothetical protein
VVFFAVVEGKTLGVGGGRELGGPHYGCHHFVRRQGFLAVILKIPTFAGIALYSAWFVGMAALKKFLKMEHYSIS